MLFDPVVAFTAMFDPEYNITLSMKYDDVQSDFRTAAAITNLNSRKNADVVVAGEGLCF